jgi:DnaK suppressor protein
VPPEDGEVATNARQAGNDGSQGGNPNDDFVPKASPDAKLTKKQLQSLYERLREEQKRLTEGMGERMSAAISDVDPLADELDIAQRHTEQANLMRFAEKERKLLVEIDRALNKMREGEYGVCEGTGEPIAVKRLELRPWTRYSVAYKEQLENERKGYGG